MTNSNTLSSHLQISNPKHSHWVVPAFTNSLSWKQNMEITSFTFLGPEDCYNTSSPCFQELKKDGGNGFFNEKELKKSRYGDIPASLLLVEEEAKQEEAQWVTESQQDKAFFESNHKRKVEEMNEYYNQLRQHYSEVDHLGSLTAKRSRKPASALAATVATTSGNDNVVVNAGNETSSGSGEQRRLCVKDRSKDWWDRCNHPGFPEEEFRKAFRMSKATFAMVCQELEQAVMKNNTMLSDAISVRQSVAVCIWRLATGEPLRLVSKRFGLEISTCHKLVLEVCSAIKTVLMPKFLQWPGEKKMKEIKQEFESISGIPNLGGSMYTTHVPIIAPKVSVAAYLNRRHTERNQKTCYSMTVQGVVDPKGIFTDVCIGWPGSMPDAQVLEMSALFHRANKGGLKDVWIVGNSGYPLMDWVLVPYKCQNLTWSQYCFNEKIDEIQNVAKEAFARLKGRWSCLQKRIEVKLQELPMVLEACCVLHNICEMSNEGMDPQLQFELFDDKMIPENKLRSANAVYARDHIAHNLLHLSLRGTSFL